MDPNSESEIEKRRLFDEAIFTLNGNSLSVSKIPDPNYVEDKELMVDEDEETSDTTEEDPVDEITKFFC